MVRKYHLFKMLKLGMDIEFETSEGKDIKLTASECYCCQRNTQESPRLRWQLCCVSCALLTFLKNSNWLHRGGIVYKKCQKYIIFRIFSVVIQIGRICRHIKIMCGFSCLKLGYQKKKVSEPITFVTIMVHYFEHFLSETIQVTATKFGDNTPRMLT